MPASAAADPMLVLPAAHPHRVPAWVQIIVSLGLSAVVVALVLPRLSDEEPTLGVLADMSLPLAAAALILEICSLVAYSMMTASIFGASVRLTRLLRIDLTATGLSHAVPAGGATAAALRMRLLHGAGVPAATAVAGATVQATASNVVLGGVFVVGVALLVATGNASRSYVLTAAAVFLAVLLVVGGGWLMLRRGSALADRVGRYAARTRVLRGRHPDRLVRALHLRARDLVEHPSRTGRVMGFAALNWLLDAAVLWVMLAATGQYLPVGPLLVVYGLGNLLAVVPLTPGGLGIVEGAMIPALLGFDVLRAAALIGVLGWRLWQFWLPIPVAGLCYLSLRIEQLAQGRSPRR